MSTMAHSVLDGEVKFPPSIDSSSSSSASVLSRSSTSPLEDRLSRAFPYGLCHLDNNMVTLISSQQKHDTSDSSLFGCSGQFDNFSLKQRQFNSIHGLQSSQISSEEYSPLTLALGLANNGIPAFHKSECEFQSKASQKLPFDFGDGVPPDALAIQERRFMTMTERIQVPSSDHVAEIVGKNGQRIKQLREQLKVWVKTPSRDEPPIFEVTGLPEKLIEAKQLIQQMSDHFTKVQQERLARAEPNRVEDRLYVEQDKVGLIVGASGQTIRWVQQLSDTHIATPRKQESIPGLPPPQTYFTICGTKDKVKFAKQLICEYVTLRCQGLWLDPNLEQSAEASRLVREFHQRRQATDTQRRVTPAQAQTGVTHSALLAPGLGRPLVGSGNLAGLHDDDTVKPVLMTDMKSLWPEAEPKQDSVWNHAMFGLQTDRRYSADSPSPLGPLFGGFGLDSSQLKKSFSDEQVAPTVANGWM